MGSLEYDVFISYAREDNKTGWVSALRDAIYDDFKRFSSEPFRIFFDQEAIHSRQDWELRLLEGLRTSRVLLVCLSPNYLRSKYCRWEWDEFARRQAHRAGGGDAVTGVFFVELGGDEHYDEQITAWRHQVTQVHLVALQEWFPHGVAALQQEQVRESVRALGRDVYDNVRQAGLARHAPGNLRRHNANFVGRVDELRVLRHQLTGGAVGVVTAVHGIGGMGKTELVVTYAHGYAHQYQGGTWLVDADKHADMLEAISTLAQSSALKLQVSAEDRRDPQRLGWLVLARLEELIDAARARDQDTAACLLILDNVSDPKLLSEEQLGVLPQQSWLHVAVTTRLGRSDIGAAGSRASVAMVEVDRLDDEDALALIREHQPARDAARLRPDFSSPTEEDSARKIVELLDGYTLAIEQAAVYLGSFSIQPSELLVELQASGTAALDTVGSSPAAAQAIRHKEKLAGAIVDQTLQRLPQRARSALAFASLLPADTIPWEWLRELSEPAQSTAVTGLSALSEDGWSSTQRILEGRRLLTQADNPRFARLHRVLQAHLRTQLMPVYPETERRLDNHVRQISLELENTATPDSNLLAVTAATLIARLNDGRHELADSALWLVWHVRHRLDLTTAGDLAAAAVATCEQLAAAHPDNTQYQEDLAASLGQAGDVLADRGEPHAALDLFNRALHIRERLAADDPHRTWYQRGLAIILERVGVVLFERGDVRAALNYRRRALEIRDRLAAADPDDRTIQGDLAISINQMGDQLRNQGETEAALDCYRRSLRIVERLSTAEPDDLECQRDMEISLNRMGEVLSKRGDLDDALTFYRRALQISERISAADPANTQYRDDLAACLSHVGDTHFGTRDMQDALTYWSRGLRVSEELATVHPANPHYQQRLSVLLNDVGCLLRLRGDLRAALDHHIKSLLIAARLRAADPQNTEYENDVSFTTGKIMSVLRSDGSAASAADWPEARLILASLDAEGLLSSADRIVLDYLEFLISKREK